MKRFLMIAITTFLVVACFGDLFAWTTYSTSNYTISLNSGIVRQSQVSEAPGGTTYKFNVRVDVAGEYAKLFIPTGNAESATLTYSASSDSDSVFVNLSYGAAFDINGSEQVYTVETLVDTTLYWDKTAASREVNLKAGYFPAPYLVIDVATNQGSLSTACQTDVTLRVFVRRKD